MNGVTVTHGHLPIFKSETRTQSCRAPEVPADGLRSSSFRSGIRSRPAAGVAESSNAVVVYFGRMCFNCRVNFCIHTGPTTSNSFIMLIQNLGSPPLQPTGAQNGCA
jgi:hypothetical protein